ncbi:MAG TPA: hypothetical protein VGZ52_05090 [Acidimicrobiales bacterium]|nr:hypothetical protein [Acidimicrobiales bacterium]
MSTSDESASDPAREGLEHLQAAAHEMIAAARSMLDAVEELLDDPRAATSMTTAFGTLGRLVEGAMASLSGVVSRSSDHDDEPRVQRIRVS